MFAIAFPQIDPVLVHIGPVSVHWYGIAYVVGLLLGWQYALWIAKRFSLGITKVQIDDFMMWALAGIIIGGRLGHILFFDFSRFMTNPAEIFMTWKGGMSFHGGMIGVIIAILLYCRKTKIPVFQFSDVLSAITPIGLFFGRIANFINSELYGRITDVPWAVVFPNGGPLPRHPSQIYEAFLEGLLLLVLIHIGWRIPTLRNVPGRLTGLFLFTYGLGRTLVEFVREPDAFYSILGIDLTTGQLLSLPMMIVGAYFIWQPHRCHEKAVCL